MRILVHDYSGHPFQVQLSRELARRGHDVLHQHFVGFLTPKGALVRREDDPPTFAVEGLELGEAFAKYSFVKRRRQEIAIGRKIAQRLAAWRPDAVLASNIPLDPLRIVQQASRRAGARFVFWQQDIYSAAMTRLLPRKLPVVGHAVAGWYQRLEAQIVRDSDAVVCITDDFVPQLESWGLPRSRATVIENWAPLDEIVPCPRDNSWAAEHGLVGRRVILYSGTLSLKHDPSLIRDLCLRFQSVPDLVFLVVSEGPGADWLREQAVKTDLSNLRVLPFQPYGRFSEVLATATVVLAIIEANAGAYSVPSKVLSYLSAGRPILLAVPPENLAARTVLRVDAGQVVPSGDREGLGKSLEDMLANPEELNRKGYAGRSYAEQAFAIRTLGDRFEAVLSPAAARMAAA